ncbi:B3/B4 domain-containing protein [Alkaliflexus imshenetskii]|uniref:B3/B4 domain-containing protein n=1 Tax=Alkaliflexus imshenetskii TaxID=286730 RepID=UPI0012FC9AEB|nr:phenylalanine--tRNA ligase beta subunit-related protein [Alkaliflexus imshenetskii]
MKLDISPEICRLFPSIKIGCILADVQVNPSNAQILTEMEAIIEEMSSRVSPDTIREMPVVASARNAYRRMGQDPNRYRPAAESLLRRIASGKGLYHVNNMVDILNLVSVQTGFSIGGYDADKIEGRIVFGIGFDNEPYEGIGRGVLNITKLPVFRDDRGAFGTSTSDSVRTMVTGSTMRFLMVFPAFYAMDNELNRALALAVDLLERLGDVKKPEYWIV